MEGHVSRDCSQEAKPKTCYKCGGEGHIVRAVVLPSMDDVLIMGLVS